MNYNKVNNIAGWSVFAVALITYLSTVAPTASFWDCGEFIAVSNELEVPHPPGAPMFLLLGRLFAMFAGGKVENVAYFVNLLSVFASAFTALFTFWITTALGKRIVAANGEEPSFVQTMSIIMAGAVAGLTCTFATSIWFNAVEAEVYAMSSFFTAIVVWLMLKWDARADEPDNMKWLILIVYMMGISIGVHLLNLLAIPALVLMYYFRKYKFTLPGFMLSMVVAVGILWFVNSFVIKHTFGLAMKFEKIFTGTYSIADDISGTVSGMGMPFGTGAIIFTFILIGAFVFALYYSHKTKNVMLNVSVISAMMIYLGVSSYAMIMIRSKANPPINENNPSNILNFLSYMNREQYGDWPVFYGPMYNAQVIEQVKGGDMLYKFIDEQKPENWKSIANVDVNSLNNRYVVYGNKPEYKYVPGTERYFPRMHSASHYNAGYYGYANFVSDRGETASPYDDNPTGFENISFFFSYQLKYMYIRYFLWNFVGREGDDQGEIDDWESGLNFVSLSEMPESYKNHAARNHYYFLPLLLGLLGMFWHAYRNEKDAAVVGMLFFFTGLAIILYLNQTPQQPRERDYSYAGSIQTFCIWVGLGALALIDLLTKSSKNPSPAVVYGLGGLSILAVPVNMAAQNWKDHSRAGNYFATDSARNYLESLAPNAIVYTNGDNDTFPLWYLQEVEGVRTDVRIINLSLLNTDWYIHQLKSDMNKAKAVPISKDETYYMGEKNGLKPVNQATKIFELPVSAKAKENLVKSGALTPQDTAAIGNKFIWKVKMRGSKDRYYLQKQDLMILDILKNIAEQDWERPMYFAISVPNESYVSLDNYMTMEGMASRVVPKSMKRPESPYAEAINREIMYKNLMEKFQFRGLSDPDVFYDSNSRRMASNFRSNYIRLAMDYLDEANYLTVVNRELNKESRLSSEEKRDSIQRNEVKIEDFKKKAKNLTDFIQSKITDDPVPTEPYYLAQFAGIYLKIGENEKGKSLINKARERARDEFNFSKIRTGEAYVLADNRMMTATYQVMAMHYLEDLKDRKSAMDLAREYQTYTGQPDLVNFVNSRPEMRNMNIPDEEQTAPQDSTRPTE